MTLQTLLETSMLICFGIAWPVANLRMLRRRRPEGKGPAFTLIILVGYLAGGTAKWLSLGDHVLVLGVFWLFVANGLSVSMNLALQWHFGRCQAIGDGAGGSAFAYQHSAPPAGLESIADFDLNCRRRDDRQPCPSTIERMA